MSGEQLFNNRSYGKFYGWVNDFKFFSEEEKEEMLNVLEENTKLLKQKGELNLRTAELQTQLLNKLKQRRVNKK